MIWSQGIKKQCRTDGRTREKTVIVLISYSMFVRSQWLMRCGDDYDWIGLGNVVEERVEKKVGFYHQNNNKKRRG